ncbi:uncharacterized protein LOC143213030 [Lasioglossum baleicum]|uniref:uncharacterized protein LOC143213030 n=1 Tax=Lasioglossum baleicum TaxID=434251 RepID=UPI003FCD074F
MSRSIFTLFAALAVFQVVSAVDVSKNKSIRLEFGDNDGIPKAKLAGDERGTGFIGDLTVGRRYADETVFRRVIEFENPTNVIQSSILNLSITNGAIHYVSARNNQGSFAVVCDNPSTLGQSSGSINLRVPPTSTSVLSLTIASHQ